MHAALGGNRVKGLAIVVASCLLPAAAARAVVIHVDADAGGASNGFSWADAHTDLQPALVAASSGDEIWVAEGTYKPTNGTDRMISFTLVAGVAVYGGFAGTETVRGERDPAANVTTLSGDIRTAGGHHGQLLPRRGGRLERHARWVHRDGGQRERGIS